MGITREPTSEFGKFLVGGGDRLAGLSAGLAEVTDILSITTSLVDKVVESSIALTVGLDDAFASFAMNTGQSGKFNDQIADLERNFFAAGVSVTDSQEAFESLFNNVNDFTAMSENTQNELAETVAILNEFGISSDLTAKNIQLLTKTLGMAEPEAAKLTRELLDFSQALGLSQKQVADDLSNFGPMLAALGQEGPEAFQKLQVQVKATGLEMSELLQITDQFNKFDTAAQAVGKLNAMLGGPFLNTLEMVNGAVCW
jgi:ABC-type transporter Mla subunit MlaD